jgi:hypothetical protein
VMGGVGQLITRWLRHPGRPYTTLTGMYVGSRCSRNKEEGFDWI